MYTKRIPNLNDVVRLSTLVKGYPVKRSDVVRVARMWNFKPEVISFLRQFPADEEFETRTDLVNRTEELSLLIRQEWESPHEFLLNP
jgi:hypothetical protein